MKKNLTYNLLLLAFVLVFFGCSSDDSTEPEDEPDTEIVITTENFTASVNENEDNDTSLGTVSATVNEGTIEFIIKSQTPDNAVSIDSSTGELFIADNTAFDYETNTSITGVIEAKVDTESEEFNFTITINDIQDSTVTITSNNSFEVDENVEVGTTIGTIVATTDGTEALIYSIESVSVDNAITIDSNLGVINVFDSSVFDFESLTEITATVKVSLENTTISTTQDIIITILDVEEALTASTFAGSTAGSTDGDLSIATFDKPTGLAMDSDGNIYVTEYGNHTIRKITPAGTVSTLVGGFNGYADGTGTDARLFRPGDIIMGIDGYLYVADTWNNRIRKVSVNGEVTTLAGSTAGFADGTGTEAKFDKPSGLTTDAAGNIYVADMDNERIRKITPSGVVTTIAGGTEGYNDGTGSDAQFKGPTGIVLNNSNELMVTDEFGRTIRKVTLNGVVTVFAGNGISGSSDGVGTNSSFGVPNGITLDNDGNLIVSDRSEDNIRQISTSAEVTTIAGTRTTGNDDGIASDATFNEPAGMVVALDGTIYIADYGNNSIRALK
jgi:sugar lactone lactonase YvrE